MSHAGPTATEDEYGEPVRDVASPRHRRTSGNAASAARAPAPAIFVEEMEVPQPGTPDVDVHEDVGRAHRRREPVLVLERDFRRAHEHVEREPCAERVRRHSGEAGERQASPAPQQGRRRASRRASARSP